MSTSTRTYTFSLLSALVGAVALTAILWASLLFFNPSFVQYSYTDTGGKVGEADGIRCLSYSLVFVVMILVIVWLYASLSPK